MPQGGVTAFQTNFYIDTEELERARKDCACSAHPSNDVVSFCTSCDKAICVECMLGEHKPHVIQTITAVAVSARAQLTTDKQQLQNTVDAMKGHKVIVEKKQSMLKRQADKVKHELKERCTQLVALAEKCRDTQLGALESLTSDLSSSEKDTEIVASLEKKWTELAEEQRKIEQLLNSGQDLQIVLHARDWRLKHGGQNALQALLSDSWPPTVWGIPYLRNNDLNASESLSSAVSAAIGSVSTRKVLQLQFGVHMQEVIHCSKGGIYFMTIFENSDVCISFDQKDLPVQKFNAKGKLIDTVMQVTGKVTMQSLANGECLYVAATPSDKHALLAKSARQFVFEQNSSIQGIVKKVHIKSTKTLTSEWVPVFTLNCTTGLVFDINDTGTKVAILESSQDDEETRVLKIYQSPNPDPLHSVSLKSCHVSDICFCKIDGKEVLLIADEIHNGILLFDMEQGCICRHRFEHPFLVQPVALNTDRNGRVWVGCRTGKIFVCDKLVLR